MWSRPFRYIGLAVFAAAIGATLLMLATTANPTERSTDRRAGTVVSLAAAPADLARDTAVATADGEGRIAPRFEFDPSPYDWSRTIDMSVVASGSEGGRARLELETPWPEPRERHPGPRDPWERMEEGRDRGLPRLEQALARVEAAGREKLPNKEEIADGLRARIEQMKERRAAGFCGGPSTEPNLSGFLVYDRGEYVALGCGFEPGERVTAELTFDFTAEPVPRRPAAARAVHHELMVYSGLDEQLIGPIIRRYERESGTSVAARYGDQAAVTAAIIEDGGNGPADVFIARDPSRFHALAKAGRLQQLPRKSQPTDDPQSRPSGDLWVSTSRSGKNPAYSVGIVKGAKHPDEARNLLNYLVAGAENLHRRPTRR